MNIEKKILLSVALFIGTMFGAAPQDRFPLMRVNTEIAKTRHSIDSVRVAHAAAMERQLKRNRNHQYILEHAAEVDSLPRVNDRLLTRAMGIIRKKYPSALLTRTPVLFIQYRNMPDIYFIKDMYYNNIQKIQEYNRRVAEYAPQYQLIKNRCDSAMHAQIDMYQTRMDSLLNVKLQLIR